MTYSRRFSVIVLSLFLPFFAIFSVPKSDKNTRAFTEEEAAITIERMEKFKTGIRQSEVFRKLHLGKYTNRMKTRISGIYKYFYYELGQDQNYILEIYVLNRANADTRVQRVVFYKKGDKKKVTKEFK